MSGDVSKAVLVTGCSIGIGRATAERLARGGWTVYATARQPESIRDLEASGSRVLALDVCDEASMRSAVAEVEKREGAVGVLVNNAGYGSVGPFEEVPIEEVRRQRVIERAIGARRPRTRYPVTPSAYLLMGLRRWLPDRGFDAFLRTQFKTPST